MYSKDDLTDRAYPIEDEFLLGLKAQWYEKPQKIVEYKDFIGPADEWFKDTKINNLQGWNKFPNIDVIIGCTHYIDSFVIRHGWNNLQILPEEYSYYTMMGKMPNEVGNLQPGIPLIISLPNWKWGDIRPEWNDVLKECEEKNIDIHIDMAWMITARDIDLDFDHPNIKSFAMSLSKYALQWNRIGLRWSKQRTVDSITMFNHYYGDVNSSLTSCGAFMIDNIPRDYAWNTYGDKQKEVCDALDLIPSKTIHTAYTKDSDRPVGIAKLLLK